VPEGSEGNQQSPDFREEGVDRLVEEYYRILGVERETGAEDIGRTFHQIALRQQPDRDLGNAKEAGDRLREINKAYEVRGNEQKRYQCGYSTSYRRSQTQKVNTALSDDLDSLASRNLGEQLRILVALHSDRS
jgi:curved DNA-binding protein CbpA